MIKQLILLLNLIAVIIYNAIFPSGVTIENKTPESIKPGEEITVEIIINKGEVNSFAKFEQIIPIGFTASQLENAGATFSFTDQKVKFIWMSLPADAQFKISYKLKANPDAKGSHTITGKFSYILNNERSSVEIPNANITVNTGEIVIKEEPKKEEPKVETPKETTPSSEPKKLIPSISCKRKITEINNNEYSVNLLIEKENIEGFVKLEELIPSGFSAAEAQSAGATFSFADEKVKIMWVAMPTDKIISVSYKLITNNPSSGNYTLSGALSYMQEEENKKYLIDNSSFTFKAPETVTQKIEEPKKEEVIKEEPKKEDSNKNELKKEEPIKEENNNAKVSNIPLPEKNVKYKVQIAATHQNISDMYFKNKYNLNDKIAREMHEGWNKFTVGGYPTYKDARDKRNNIWNNNKITDAFVTAYNNGVRVTVQEALMISNQKWIQ
jgi:hypothetical protein